MTRSRRQAMEQPGSVTRLERIFGVGLAEELEMPPSGTSPAADALTQD
jgi:hypothetical protein